MKSTRKATTRKVRKARTGRASVDWAAAGRKSWVTRRANLARKAKSARKATRAARSL